MRFESYRKPSKRTIALDIIRIEHAMHGEMTREAMRAYIENRVSFAAMKEAAATGLRQFAAIQASKAVK